MAYRQPRHHEAHLHGPLFTAWKQKADCEGQDERQQHEQTEIGNDGIDEQVQQTGTEYARHVIKNLRQRIDRTGKQRGKPEQDGQFQKRGAFSARGIEKNPDEHHAPENQQGLRNIRTLLR